MKYPTRSGLAIPPSELGYAEVPHERRRTNNHHLYYERYRYDQRWRSVFRNLTSHVQPMLIEEHTDLHERFDSPRVPNDTLMIDVVEEYLSLNGAIDCVREKRTQETYQIQEEEWQMIKGLYRRAA